MHVLPRMMDIILCWIKLMGQILLSLTWKILLFLQYTKDLCQQSSVQPCCLHNEDTNLLPKTTLEKSTMKSSGILKEKSKTKQLGIFCNHSYTALPEKTLNLLQNTKDVSTFSIA